MTAGIVSVGYEGREIDEFVFDLARWGVSILVDVRLNPISRKVGFSKTKLAAALDGSGIRYRHYRELGNPKENRSAFARDPATGRAVFQQALDTPAGKSAIREVAACAEREVVAVLCFERDHNACHRYVVVDAVTAQSDVRVVKA